VGWSGVRTDFLFRALGLREKAHALATQLPPRELKLLQAYAHGVNLGWSAAREAGTIYEWTELGVDPQAQAVSEDWAPQDSILLVLLQSFDQTSKSFETDLKEEALKELYGESALRSLFSLYGTPWEETILKEGEYAKKNQASHLDPSPEALPQHRGSLKTSETQEYSWSSETGSSFGGSNNWVLGRSRSQSGNAWLASDPHLSLKHPPFWHYSQIQSPTFEVLGVSVPGVPVVVSGNNRSMAWGLTNAYLDVADLYRVPESELRDLEVHRPKIWFKFWKFRLPMFFKTFQRLPTGEVTLPIGEVTGKKTLLRWTGLMLEAQDLVPLFEISVLRRVEEMDEVLSRIGVPTWNFVYADTQGGIGYRAIGKVPKRFSAPPIGIEEFPSVSELPKWDFLTRSEMPHVLRPTRDYVVTANSLHWPLNAQFSGGRSYSGTFRTFRIERLLDPKRTPKHTRESIHEAQCDTQAVEAPFLLPKALEFLRSELLDPTPEELDSIRLLEKWDFNMKLDCEVCPLYRRWMDQTGALVKLDEASAYRLLHANDQSAKSLGLEAVALKNLQSDLRVALARTFRETVRELSPLKADRPQGRLLWGDFHQAWFPNLAGAEIAPSKVGLPSPGDRNSVVPGIMEWKKRGYEHTWGQSQRLIVELTDPPTVWHQLAGPIEDLREKRLTDPKGAWVSWANCQMGTRREFPFDWKQAEKRQKLEF
jgi:penicillin amidase